ncbi:hypothetical protein GQX74_003619 [Glossina fuscipes]|nr:hypothetical protein GQX74_003619 [Glossina fuscipes]
MSIFTSNCRSIQIIVTLAGLQLFLSEFISTFLSLRNIPSRWGIYTPRQDYLRTTMKWNVERMYKFYPYQQIVPHPVSNEEYKLPAIILTTRTTTLSTKKENDELLKVLWFDNDDNNNINGNDH